jgi:hypothetical protein
MIGELLQTTPDEIDDRLHHRVEGGQFAEGANWFGTVLPKKYLQSRGRRVSPASLKSSPHHRSVWMVRPLTFCPESWELLIGECPYCERPLGWHRTLGPWRCETCGRSLRHHKGDSVPEKLRDNLRIASALVSTDPAIRIRAMESLPSPFCAWGAGDVFAAAVELGTGAMIHRAGGKLADASSLARFDFSYFSEEHLAAGIELISGWESKFPNLVKDVVLFNLRSTKSARRALGFFGKYFTADCADTYLRKEIRRCMPKIISSLNAPIKTYDNSSIPVYRNSMVFSRSEASKSLKICARTLCRLDKKGESSIRSRGHKSETKLFNAKKLSASVKFYRSSISGSVAAARLGLPSFAMTALANDGVIDRVFDRDAMLMAQADQLYTSVSIDTLRDALFGVAQGRDDGGISVWKALEREAAPAIWSGVIKAILSGELYASWNAGPNAAAGEALSLQPIAVQDFRVGLRHELAPEDVTICEIEAARVLGTSPVVVSQAVKSGLLRAARSRRRLEIPLKALAEFSSEFILNGEIADRMGVHSAACRERMSDCGITPIRACPKARIWPRAEVEALLAERRQMISLRS